MTERPILFSGPLVRAILRGEKTETRRLVTPKSARARQLLASAGVAEGADREILRETLDTLARECSPYGQPGDTLWVRETWGLHWLFDDLSPEKAREEDPDCVFYRADGEGAPSRLVPVRVPNSSREHITSVCEPSQRKVWRPSIHMPRWASRITLAVTEVRVERLQEIDGRSVLAEGVDNGKSNPTMGVRWENMQRMAFQSLWDSINGKRPGASWEANPWVWVIKFQRLEPGERGGW